MMKIYSTLLLLLLSIMTFGQDTIQTYMETEVPVIEFEDEVYDFGDITQGEKLVHVFKFKNTGTVPLQIAGAKGSCGCTVPYYPKVPIMPGEESEIEVIFDSNGKMGRQHKKVTIVANTMPATSVVAIKGNILPQEDTEMHERLNKQQEEDRATLESIDKECVVLFPNPTSETLQLELRDNIGKSAVVEIHDRAGNLIQKKEINSISHESTKFDVSSFSEGVYLISIYIQTDNKYLTQCFVVSRD